MIPKVIKAGGYKIQESKNRIIDDDGRLALFYVKESDVLLCCDPVRVGKYIKVERIILPSGTVVKRVWHDPEKRCFVFMIWNMQFDVVEDSCWPRDFAGTWDIEVFYYKIADQ